MAHSQIFKSIELIASSIPNPFYWKDKNGILLGINEIGWQTLEGMLTPADMIGKMLLIESSDH